MPAFLKGREMTTRLFDTEPYATIALAEVLSCEETEHNKRKMYALVLDLTIFFPEEGGQSPDKGTINNIEVLDVQVDGEDIIHYIDTVLTVGESVQLSIDWRHRFSNMQQHSGEHIFSGTVHRLFGFDNVGFHLSDNSVTMDFSGVLSAEDIKKVEDIVNEAISKNVDIIAEYPSSEVLETLDYRSKKEIDGPVRIVTVDGYDICACCAPHVARTGEIGIFKVIHATNYKGGVRIDFLCGFRALEYFRQSLEIIDELSANLTTGRENLVSHVASLKEERANLSSQLLAAKQKLIKEQIKNYPQDEPNIVIFFEKTDNLVMKNTVNELLETHDGLVAFFGGNDVDGYNYMLASKTTDTRDYQKKLSKLGAKGGGKPEMVCGNVAAPRANIEEALALG